MWKSGNGIILAYSAVCSGCCEICSICWGWGTRDAIRVLQARSRTVPSCQPHPHPWRVAWPPHYRKKRRKTYIHTHTYIHPFAYSQQHGPNQANAKRKEKAGSRSSKNPMCFMRLPLFYPQL